MYFVQGYSKYLSKIQKAISSEILPGILLLTATVLALIIANNPLGETYHHIFSEVNIFRNMNLHAFINDFLMAIFFLVVGCEIKKEVVSGHLSNLKKASFPIIGAIGGVTVPAIIFYILNHGTPFQNGIGVPISTDIAFAIGAFMLFKNKLNSSLKIFLLTLAVVDDLLSIVMIGVFYSSDIRIVPLIFAGIVFLILLNIHRVNKGNKIYPYMVLGLALWVFVFSSGVHATISGVLLAMTIPINKNECKCCMLTKIEHTLSPYANLIILPLFAFANTAIMLNMGVFTAETATVSMGIVIGLVVGKPLGIMIFTMIASKINLIEKPSGVKWLDVLSVAMLAGIGFTMSIFVSEIAFSGNQDVLDLAKLSILIAAIISCTLAFIMITITTRFRKKSA